MKKMLCLLLAVCSLTVLCACAKTGPDPAPTPAANSPTPEPARTSAPMPEPTPDSTPEPVKDTASANGYMMKIVAAHKTVDSNGAPMAAVEIAFTNSNSVPASFMSCGQVKGFQNGIQLFKEEMFLENDFDWDTYYTEIKDGATISVFRPLPVQNTDDPVEVTVDIVDMMNGKFLDSATVTLDLTD